MNESGSKNHKPVFSQTFLGAIIVAVVGGVLVWVVTNNLSERSSSTSSTTSNLTEPGLGTPPSEEGETSASPFDPTPAPTPPPTPTPAPIRDPVSNPQTVQGFEFFLDRCAMEGEHLNCWLKVTNITGQGSLSIFRDDSWLKDQDDKKHEVWRVLDGNGKPEFNILQLKKLPINSPELFGLHFKEVNGIVTSIKYLNLQTRDFNLGWPDVKVE